jgi:hypothetical protein
MIENYNKPDFIGIGIQKSGTSWLYRQLREHPEVYLPPLKELRFFLEGDRIPRKTLWNLFFSTTWHYRSMRRHFSKRFFSHQRTKTEKKQILSYYLHPHTLSWYAGYFNPDKISGEFTPHYYKISEDRIKLINRHFPSLKIILMLRDPVSRVWSQYKMNLKKRSSVPAFENVSIDNPHIQRILAQTPPYEQIISIWKSHFDKVGVFFYDEIHENPGHLMENVFKFIGCSPVQLDNSMLNEKINSGPKSKIPAQLRLDLTQYYIDEAKSLVSFTDHPTPKKWLDNYTRLLENNCPN